MSNFDNISKIKENFVENLNENNSYFNKAKSALINFDNFMQNSPKIVTSLSAACIVAIASVGYNIYEDNYEYLFEQDKCCVLHYVHHITSQLHNEMDKP